MVASRTKYVNGRVFIVKDNSEDQVIEIWSTDDRFLQAISYGPDCEKLVDESLKRISLDESLWAFED